MSEEATNNEVTESEVAKKSRFVVQTPVEDQPGTWRDVDLGVPIRDTQHAASVLRKRREAGVYRILTLRRTAEVKEVPRMVMETVLE